MSSDEKPDSEAARSLCVKRITGVNQNVACNYDIKSLPPWLIIKSLKTAPRCDPCCTGKAGSINQLWAKRAEWFFLVSKKKQPPNRDLGIVTSQIKRMFSTYFIRAQSSFMLQGLSSVGRVGQRPEKGGVWLRHSAVSLACQKKNRDSSQTSR